MARILHASPRVPAPRRGDTRRCALLHCSRRNVSAACQGRNAMLQVLRSAERGFADHGWLKSHHTFSFADYHDPDWVHYGPLRVINDDYVAPGQGFGKHGHRDMEILTYILEGELEHKDSMGNGSVIRPGRRAAHERRHRRAAQRVQSLGQPAGAPAAGVDHARAERLAPGYEQKHFTSADKRGRLRLIASPRRRARARWRSTRTRGSTRACSRGAESQALAVAARAARLGAPGARVTGRERAAAGRRGCRLRRRARGAEPARRARRRGAAVRPALGLRRAAPAGSGPRAAPRTAT